VEYWISHPDLPGLLSPQDIADRGNQLINADVDLLYYDMSRRNLDPRDLYEQLDVNTFTADQQVDPSTWPERGSPSGSRGSTPRWRATPRCSASCGRTWRP